MPSMLEALGVNVVAFPSIVPETFSYVVSEVLAMDLPIVAFDIGAQGQRVAASRRGKVVEYDGLFANDAGRLLDGAMEMFEKSYRRNAELIGEPAL